MSLSSSDLTPVQFFASFLIFFLAVGMMNNFIWPRPERTEGKTSNPKYGVGGTAYVTPFPH
jgi:hypothetical protein